jgi:hydrogenase nickel incorporation protein HypB
MLQTIRVQEKLLGKNDELAARNRERLDAAGVFVVSLCGSPGGGKTSLLERVVPMLGQELRIAVIEGDVETDRDGQRIAALDVPVTQLVTGGTCHLDAQMISRALDQLPVALAELDVLFIENVGNLVCPASYALGENVRVVVLSLTEGEDKPLKYPAMFRKTDGLVINKLDLAPYLRVNLQEMEAAAHTVQPGLAVFRVSCFTDQGIAPWIAWLKEGRACWQQQQPSNACD